MSSTKLILSLDGGGVRGKFDLEIINNIENYFQEKIYNIFDLVVGVSAGAATAAMIATKSYVDLRQSSKNSNECFENRSSLGPLMETKYDGTGKRKWLHRELGNLQLEDISYPLVILTASINGDAQIFSSWSEQQKKIKLYEVIDASTAAPIFFPPVKIGSEYFMDGGTISNDPVLAGIQAAKQKWGDDVNLAVLSLGTGMVSQISIDETLNPQKFGMIKWLSEGLIDILTRSNNQLYVDVIPLIIGNGNYFRLTSTVIGNLDDVSEKMHDALKHNAEMVWDKYSHHLVQWIKSKKPEYEFLKNSKTK
jgi:predicted patatin/cPLA2 family phospholipase